MAVAGAYDDQDTQAERCDDRAVDAARMRERRCIVSRLSGNADTLIRFALAPDARVTPDLREILPGRGCWIAAERALVERAVAKQLFGRAFKTQALAPADLADTVDHLLKDDALRMLSLARKAGQLMLGEMQVVTAARSDRLACVAHAGDGAQNGLKKVQNALAAAGAAQTPLIRVFTVEELSLALGLPNVIHAAMPAGRLGAAFAAKARKLAVYRGLSSTWGGVFSAASFTTDRTAGPADLGQDPGS